MTWFIISYAVIAFAVMAGTAYYLARQDGKPAHYGPGGDMGGTMKASALLGYANSTPGGVVTGAWTAI